MKRLLILLPLALLNFACDEDEDSICACAYNEIPVIQPQMASPMFLAPDPGFLKATEEPEYSSPLPAGKLSFFMLEEHLNRDTLPPEWLIAPTEIFNAFKYDSPMIGLESPPPLSMSYAVHPAPWDPSHRLVRIQFDGTEVSSQTLDFHLKMNLYNVHHYRIIASAESSPENQPTGGLNKSENRRGRSHQTTIFIEVILRPEISSFIEDLVLFDLEITGRDSSDGTLKRTLVDKGAGDLTASKDFQFSAGLAWWSLHLTGKLYYYSAVWDLIPYIQQSLDPQNHPEREDVIPMIEKFDRLVPRNDWDCLDPNPYPPICEC